MDAKDEKYLILEQYRIYSDAKEKFIERQFSTNRFYLVLNLILLITICTLNFVFNTLMQGQISIAILSIIGFAIAIMWWMNIDSYQILIKIKYAKVLEYLETKLPEQPFHKEFVDYKDIKKKNNLIVFGDVQKYLTLVIAITYVAIFACKITDIIKYQFI